MRLVIGNEKPSLVFCQYNNEFERQELKNWMTIKMPGARYSTKVRNKQWDGKKCFYNRFTDSFPIGFLSRVLHKWPDAKVVDERVYQPIPFKIPELNAIDEFYKPTGSALVQRMYQKEAVLCAFEFKNCLIQAATNAGKSAVMAALVKLLRQERVLIVVHRIELLHQLRKMLMGMTGLPIGYIESDGVMIDPYINISMVMTLLKRIDTIPEVREVFFGSKVLIADECHHMKSETYTTAFCRSKAVYRIGCSGTIQDEDTYEGWLVRQYIGDVVFNKTNKELIDMGISAAPKIKMMEYRHDIDYTDLVQEIRMDDAAKGITYQTAWKEREEVYKRVYKLVSDRYIIRNVARNKVVVDQVCGAYMGKQILIVVDYLDHGQMIMDMIDAKIGKEYTDFIHGESESRKGSLLAFKQGRLKILISSSIIDEGIDISRIEVLILAGGKKSKRQILQRIGRGLRRKKGENVVTVLDFYDYDGKYLEKHSKIRKSIYIQEGFDIEMVKV